MTINEISKKLYDRAFSDLEAELKKNVLEEFNKQTEDEKQHWKREGVEPEKKEGDTPHWKR